MKIQRILIFCLTWCQGHCVAFVRVVAPPGESSSTTGCLTLPICTILYYIVLFWEVVLYLYYIVLFWGPLYYIFVFPLHMPCREPEKARNSSKIAARFARRFIFLSSVLHIRSSGEDGGRRARQRRTGPGHCG